MMAEGLSRQLVLFGFDLSIIWRYAILGLDQMLEETRFLARHLQAPVLLWRPRLASVDCYQAGRCVERFAGEDFQLGRASTTDFFAVELSEEFVLFRELVVPVQAEIYLDDMVRMEVAGVSPFADDRTISAWTITARTGTELSVLIAITDDEHLEAAKTTFRDVEWVTGSADPEVWAIGQDEMIVKFPSERLEVRLSEFRAKALAATRRLALFWVLGACVIIAPAVASALRVDQVTEELQRVKADASDETVLADEVRAYRARSERLAEQIAGRENYHFWLNHIAQVTPDDVFLSQVDIESRSVLVSGFSANAAAYLGRLTEESAYTDVRASSAFVRDQRTGLERFTISWKLIPQGSAE